MLNERRKYFLCTCPEAKALNKILKVVKKYINYFITLCYGQIKLTRMMLKCRVSKNNTGKAFVELCWNNYVCIHFEKLLRLFGIKVLKTSLYTSSARKNQTHLFGLLNAVCGKNKKKKGIFFCVIPSKVTIAFVVASIL